VTARPVPASDDPDPSANASVGTAALATSGAAPRRRGPAAAALVALGILVTRLFGLLRTRVTARYLGLSDEADVLAAATRIPNVLQNLFGEGVLSASFIPVYARLLARGERDEADRVAGAVFGVLAAAMAALVAVGVLATPFFVDTIASGFVGAKRELTVRVVRILFPGTGLLVLSAWCLGVLNSHRRFFLSYAAPVAWNVAIIGAAVYGGVMGRSQSGLVELIAWWTVVGCALQFLVQLPAVLRALGHFRPSLDATSAHVREVLRNFVPTFVARGAVQISAYVDMGFASQLGTGPAAALGYAQQIYLLPVGLFGMSISAAALPAMSGTGADDAEARAALRAQLLSGLRTIAYFVVPSAMAFLALGDVVAGTILQTGAFTRAKTEYTWAVLAGSGVGLLASTLGRLYSSTFYALKDTRTPFRFALVRIVLSIGLGWLFAFPLPAALGLAPRWGAAGLTASAGLAGWVEFLLLRREIGRRIGDTAIPGRHLGAVWLAAAAAAALAWGAKWLVGVDRPLLDGLVVLGCFAAAYLAATLALGVPEARRLVDRVLARVGRGRGAARGAGGSP
jgi:putative peptidoglycan lipid II flippase